MPDTALNPSTIKDRKPAAKHARTINPAAFTFTLNDAVAMSGLSVATLRRRERDGMLKFVRIGSRTLVNGDSLRRLVGANAE